jgi:hypothetical protein
MYPCTRSIPVDADLAQAQRAKDFFKEIQNSQGEFRVLGNITGARSAEDLRAVTARTFGRGAGIGEEVNTQANESRQPVVETRAMIDRNDCGDAGHDDRGFAETPSAVLRDAYCFHV